MAGARIRRLGERDVDRAVALTDLEGWGYSPADVRRLLDLSEGGCFAAESEGRIVGLLTTTPYGKVAYLGAVIVEPNLRGRGIGGDLMRAALAHLDARGIETVRLNSYPHVTRFYERLGFRREYENVRWEGAPSPIAASPDVRAAAPADLDAVVAFDAEFFGAPRRALLSRLLREFPSTFHLSESGGRIVAYVVGNASTPVLELAPWVVDPDEATAARNLYAALVRTARPRAVAFSGPEPNPRPHAFARELGLRESFRSVRMVRGKGAYPGRPEGVWSFAGLEKG